MKNIIKFIGLSIFTFICLGTTFTIIFNTRDSRIQHLYIMTTNIESVYKIGVSIDPWRRVNEVDRDRDGKKNGDVRLVKVYPDMGKLEQHLHKVFINQNYSLRYFEGSDATEWFELNADDLCILDKIVMEQYKKDNYGS